MPVSTRAIAIASAAIVGVTVTAIFVSTLRQSDDAFADCRASAVSGGGQIGGPFTLVDETGKTVTDKDVITKPSLIYFGYTFCPDICPADNARNAVAVDLLKARGYDVQPVFISIDPKRDTPDVVAAFTDAMHPDMIGLTGSEEQVAAASKAYRTYYKIQDPNDPYYLVDHSVFTYLVLPKQGFVEFFNRNDSPEEMADRVACFVDAAG